MVMRTARVWSMVAALAFLWGARGAAQTGMHDPDAPLAVLPIGDSPALAAAADRLYRETQKEVVELEQWQKAGGMQAGKIGAAHVAAVRLERIAGRLKARREAAGFDFALRAGDLRQRLLRMAGELKQIQGFSTKGAMERLAALRDAGLPKIPGWRKQISQENLAKVEVEVFALLDAMQEQLVWLEGNAPAEYLTPFQAIVDQVAGRTAEADRRAVEAELDQQLQQLQPDVAHLLAQLQAAAAEMEQSGQADWQENMLGGPQLVVAAHHQWQQLQRELQRRRAWLWARRGNSRENTPELQEVEEAQRTLAEQMPASLAAVVAADAQRVPASDAAAVYQEYLASLGGVIALGPKETLLAALEPPLDTLAARSIELHANLKAYRALTGDHLRWRRRLAAAEAEGRRNGYPLATSVFHEAAKSRLNAPGFLPEQGQGSELSAILTPVPAAIQRVGKELVGRSITILDVVGVGNRGVARYDIRTYASLPAVTDPTLTSIRDSLRSILHLSPEQPPLTLEGAAALAAVDEGIWDQVGGSIENVQVAPLIARFATLEDKDTLRMTLAPPAEEPAQLDLRNQLVVQFRVRPAWVQHELLLMEVQ